MLRTRRLLLALALGPLACSATRSGPQPAGDGAAAPPAAAAPAATAQASPPEDAAGAAGEPSLTLSAVGDCTIGSELAVTRTPGSFHSELQARGNDYRYPFAGVTGVLSRDDLTIANLETTLSTRPPASKGRYVFRGEPAFAQILVEGSVELANVANNHSYDLGVAGFDETLRALAEHRIAASGFGRVARLTVKGIEVVSLGFTGGDPAAVIEGMERDVRRHKRPDNLVIVSFHWGGEGSYEPNDAQRRLGRAAIDAGADLVLGHHPHVIQGIEVRRGKQIVYSLGNFVFGGHSNPEDKDSFIFQATFARRGGRVVPAGSELIPVRISSVTERNDFQPVLLDGAERERVLARLRALSDALPADGADGAAARADGLTPHANRRVISSSSLDPPPP
ncbi:MAG: CapA family protein [Polyangiaceae bacterium]|nr:CapA family protein [Polyangiaceae bacterium]